MSPEAQRIAIAEACGYTNVHRFNKFQEGGPSSTKDGDLVGDFGGITKRHLPSYLTDLNAMHEAETQWIDAASSQYERSEREALIESHLSKILGPTRSTFRATAAQRAEAFLRTLNLWTE